MSTSETRIVPLDLETTSEDIESRERAIRSAIANESPILSEAEAGWPERRPEKGDGTLWRFTFGQKYRYEKHPNYPKADPAGWVTIVAFTEVDALRTAKALFGTDAGGFGLWAFCYSEESWEPKWFGNGEIERIEAK